MSEFEARYENEANSGASKKRGGPKGPNSREPARLDPGLLNQVEDGLTDLTSALKKDYGSEVSSLTWLIIAVLFGTLAITFVKVNSAVNKVHLF